MRPPLYGRSGAALPAAQFRPLALVMLAGLVLIGLPAVLMPAVAVVTASQSCRGNLWQIGLALRAYQAEHGKFPPVATYDKHGKATHSWRALILGRLDLGTRTARTASTSRGMGPQIANLPPAWLRRTSTSAVPIPVQKPAQERQATSRSPVRARPGTPWQPSHGWRPPPKGPLSSRSRIRGFSGQSRKILSLDEAARGVNCGKGLGISSGHTPSEAGLGPRPAHVLFADGSVGALPANLPPERLRSILIEGPRQLQREQWIAYWRQDAATAVFISSVILLLAHGLIADRRAAGRMTGGTGGQAMLTGAAYGDLRSRKQCYYSDATARKSLSAREWC